MNLVRGWPQGQAGATPLGWSLPQPLIPPRIEGWPRGVVPSSDAESLLSTAVAWWDAAAYRDGDRFLRNRGVAGELLDLRLGSSTVANTNDPTFLAPEATGYVYLPGVAGNNLSVPDENALDITGDIDVRWFGVADDWTPSSGTGTLVSKYAPSDGQRSWSFGINTNGTLSFTYSTLGTSASLVTRTASTAVTFQDGAPGWVRVTFDVDNGASGNDVKFWTSTDGSTWVQLGNTITSAGTASIYSGSSTVNVGLPAFYGAFVSRVYRAIVKDGIDGTTVLDVDCDAITSGSATSFTATTGQTVTINRSTSGRKSVGVPARRLGGRPVFLLGTDDYFEVPAESVWQHQLLNFGQGDSFTVLAVVRQWINAETDMIVAKRDDIAAAGTERGWLLASLNVSSGFNRQLVAIADGTNVASPGSTTFGWTSGTMHVRVLQVNRSTQTVTSNIVNVGAITTSTSAVGSLSNSIPVRIGRESVGTSRYAEMEFTAAAIFRRALSAQEVQLITSYYTGASA